MVVSGEYNWPYQGRNVAKSVYPYKYYRGQYIIRDPQEWNTRGRTVPIHRMPGYMTSDDPYEEHYRVRRKRPKIRNRYTFHPFISELYYPPRRGVRIWWGLLE